MSFICKSCGVAQEAGIKPYKVVVETRNVYYPPIKDDNGNVRIPVGFEIAKETEVCNLCKNKEFNIIIKGVKIIE